MESHGVMEASCTPHGEGPFGSGPGDRHEQHDAHTTGQGRGDHHAQGGYPGGVGLETTMGWDGGHPHASRGLCMQRHIQIFI